LLKIANKPLSVQQLVAGTQGLIERAGICNPKQFTGHSFRRGGATSLHVAGIADSLIRVMGRWKSFAFARYIDAPAQLILQASKAMSTAEGKGKMVKFDLPAQHMPWETDIWD
jgi:hypothetical protein